MDLDYSYECTLSILVDNQSSILTRVVGLLTRRGFIIESLTIGSTEYDGLSRIIIVLLGNGKLIDQVTRQLYKLFAIVKIYNLTHVPLIERELVLFKMLANATERRDILKIANIFDAKVVDCTNNTVTLQVVGDPEKIVAIEELIHRFGILEKVRTGKIGLQRDSIAGGLLYTVDREHLRRRMIKPHINEIEGKFYL